MIRARVVGFPFGPVAHPSARTLSPAVADPLRWYPKSAEAVLAVNESTRVDDVIVGGPITLRYGTAVVLRELLTHHRLLFDLWMRQPARRSRPRGRIRGNGLRDPL